MPNDTPLVSRDRWLDARIQAQWQAHQHHTWWQGVLAHYGHVEDELARLVRRPPHAWLGLGQRKATDQIVATLEALDIALIPASLAGEPGQPDQEGFASHRGEVTWVGDVLHLHKKVGRSASTQRRCWTLTGDHRQRLGDLAQRLENRRIAHMQRECPASTLAALREQAELEWESRTIDAPALRHPSLRASSLR